MNGDHSNDERELDRWLARELSRSSDYIDDRGFADRVMAELPEPRATRGGRWLWLSLAAVLAGLAAVLVVPVQPLLGALVAGWLALPFSVWLPLGAVGSLLTMVGVGYWVWREVQ